MAFGFGFNKQKVLSAAEKCVQQGKLQNAISEYDKVLKADPKDLTVLNTVGDLYSRLGEQDKAAQCFKDVGDAYASQGFTVKAIAMYKKLSKLKASMECVLRLAELYTQQGLFNDARAQYLQVAEDFLKTGQLDQAVRIFEKTLEMDPDNVSMRTKLAEVYVRMGKKPEAWKILTAAAEGLRAKGQLAAADEIVQRMLKLEPGNGYALVLRGRAALDAGDAIAAIEALSKVADLDTNPEGLRALFHAYLRTKRFSDAEGLAAKLASVHNDTSGISEYAAALFEAQRYREVLGVYEQYSDLLLRNDPEKLLESLRPIIGHVREDSQALEIVLALLQKGGESTHLTEVYELLAHAYVQSGDLEKAREFYLKLMQLEPANQMHARNYQQVAEKQGSSNTTHLITPEEGSVLIDELEATAPFIDQRYEDNTALAVRAALTDAELFISYNMPGKALEPLLSALPLAPRDLRLNQKLAALHTRTGKFAEAAVCCRTLESIYHDAGHAEEASRYGDLGAKYEMRSGPASAEAVISESVQPAPPPSHAAAEFEISTPVEVSYGEAPVVTSPQPASPTIKHAAPSGLFFHASTPAVVAPEPAAAQIPSAAPAEFSIAPDQPSTQPQEALDLSAEWEQDLTVEASPEVGAAHETESQEVPAVETVPEDGGFVTPPNLQESIEEIRFYLGQGMVEQAETVLVGLEALSPGLPELAVLRLGVQSAKQSPTPQEIELEISADQPEAEVHAAEMSTPEPAVEAAKAAPVATPQPWPQERPALQEIVSELEESLGDDFLGGAQTKPISPAEEKVSAVAEEFRSGTLDDFVSDLEASLGNDFVTPAATESRPPAVHTEVPAAFAAAASAAPVHAAPSIPVMQTATTSNVSEHEMPPLTAAKPEPLAGVDLASMFGELKQELEEGGTSTEEDPETHYNLGVAFREMGLLDEAIGEFQKVCQSTDRGHAFSQTMQTYTWLAQCFLDKGIPEAAIRWYEKALKLPSLDQESRTALHYELAASFESAGNNPAALTNFLEVYGSNIDYRDVAERIKALRS